MIRHPEVKWAQRVDKVFVTVQLPDAKDAKVNLDPEGVLTFSATAGAENHLYELNLELFDKVNVEESKINKGVRSAFCVIEKAEKVWWKKLLRGVDKTPHYVRVDWDKWVDEDDESDAGGNNLDLGGMDFSNFGGMGGMGDGMGMGGGMGDGMGMGGMGMGGMGMGGGMGDGMAMGGMGDDLDESDDEGEETEKPINAVTTAEDAPVVEKMDASSST